MSLSLASSTWLSRFSPPNAKLPDYSPNSNFTLLSLLLRSNSLSSLKTNKSFKPRASLKQTQSNGVVEETSVLDEALLSRVSASKDAEEALRMIDQNQRESSDQLKGGVVSVSDCRLLINAALDRKNADLALSVFYAMRCSFDTVGVSDNGHGPLVERWKWSRPDVGIYSTLVQGLAALLRISDAFRIIDDICRVGVSPSEEVPFGKVVRCPICSIAVGVAQPQLGIQDLKLRKSTTTATTLICQLHGHGQIVCCAKCRYKYELVSGNIVSVDSEEISMEIPAWKRGLKSLQILKERVPAAVHSILVQTPSGMARTHRFATETVDIPAQEGERVTIACAAPSNVYREVGPFKFSPKAPNFYPGEPMCLTNHKDGRESQLLRAPANDGNMSILKPQFIIPLLTVLTAGDVASGIIDPSLPKLLSVAAVGSLAVGATLNAVVFPQLNQLPQRSVETTAIKQQLLSQYDVLQSRIRDLKEAVKEDYGGTMFPLFSVFSARRSRIKRVREGLENSLRGRIELIDSFAKISSMIEIEVEMDSDVLAAEAASSAKWKLQAEANDEAERLLSSQSIPTEQI
ncbi:UDP-D-glucose/UDP-D-galactose 4-epimerase 5 isoform 1 [Hibiscus syriacus]|uniref:UDP-D-glucose/UDP-D-galactose 4-epimerase 5 isoform 1 n=1 Tax=Hibiscus syriacus TaxID=106335 RepID=A0A6A3BCY0_HIBSY|nr:UDP-D-glucose/UDP-D-galactose 4-epimerase 5 isoform 1 [Hibiscus syriacus]